MAEKATGPRHAADSRPTGSSTGGTPRCQARGRLLRCRRRATRAWVLGGPLRWCDRHSTINLGGGRG